jgi:hypothetical protein
MMPLDEHCPLEPWEWEQEPEGVPKPLEVPPDCCKPDNMAKARSELVELIVSTRDSQARSIYSKELTQLGELEEKYRPYWEAKEERIKAQEKELKKYKPEPEPEPEPEPTVVTEPARSDLRLLRRKS